MSVIDTRLITIEKLSQRLQKATDPMAIEVLEKQRATLERNLHEDLAELKRLCAPWRAAQ